MLKAAKEHVIDLICRIVTTARVYYDWFFKSAYFPQMTMQKALRHAHTADPTEYTTALFDAKGNGRLFPHINSITFKYANSEHRLESSRALELRSVIEDLPSPTEHKCNSDTSNLYRLLRKAYVRCQRRPSGLRSVVRSLCAAAAAAAAPESEFPTEIHVEQNSLLMSMTGCAAPFVDSQADSTEQNVLTILKDRDNKGE